MTKTMIALFALLAAAFAYSNAMREMIAAEQSADLDHYLAIHTEAAR